MQFYEAFAITVVLPILTVAYVVYMMRILRALQPKEQDAKQPETSE